MSFLALASQKAVLNMQKNFLALQQVSILNDRQVYADMMNAVKIDNPEHYSEDSTYLMYEALDEELDTAKESIEAQMTVIDNEISSLKTKRANTDDETVIAQCDDAIMTKRMRQREIEKEFKGNEYVDKLVEFVRTSKRGCTLRDKAAYHGSMEE